MSTQQSSQTLERQIRKQYNVLLRRSYDLLTNKTPLHVLMHLAIDSWFPIERHSVAGDSDRQALQRAIACFQTAHALKFKLPNALRSPRLSAKTIRKYCALIIFTRTLGAVGTQQIDSDQPKVNLIFENPYAVHISTEMALLAFLENYATQYYTEIDVDNLHKLIEHGWTDVNNRALKLNNKIQSCINVIKHNKSQIRAINLFELLCNLPSHHKHATEKSPAHPLPEKSDSDDDDDDILAEMKQEEKDEQLHTAGNDESHSSQPAEVIISPMHKSPKSVESNKIESVPFSELIPNRRDIFDKLEPPFELTNFKSCQPSIVLKYVLDVLLVYEVEVSQQAKTESIDAQQQCEQLLNQIKQYAVKAMFAILRTPRKKHEDLYYLRQVKWLFRRLNISPSVAENYVNSVLRSGPQPLAMFPLSEQLDDTDGVDPLPITLVPPPPLMNVSDGQTEPIPMVPAINLLSQKSHSVKSPPKLTSPPKANNISTVSSSVATTVVLDKSPPKSVSPSVGQAVYSIPIIAADQAGSVRSNSSNPVNAVTIGTYANMIPKASQKTTPLVPQNKKVSKSSSVLANGLQFQYPKANSNVPSLTRQAVSFPVFNSRVLASSNDRLSVLSSSQTNPLASAKPTAVLGAPTVFSNINTRQSLSLSPSIRLGHININGSGSNGGASLKVKTPPSVGNHTSRTQKLQNQINELSSQLKSQQAKLQNQFQEQLAQYHKVQTDLLRKILAKPATTVANSSKTSSISIDNNVTSIHVDSDHSTDQSQVYTARLLQNKKNKRGGSPSPSPPSSLSSDGSKPGKRRKRRRRGKRGRKHSNSSKSGTAELTRKLEQKAIIRARVNERVHNQFECIKKNLDATFAGYPKNAAHSQAMTNQVCAQAIAFIVHVLMWFAIFVTPHKAVYTEQMAVAKAISHLHDTAHSQFLLHQSTLHYKINTLTRFVMYLLKQYIKLQHLPALKTAILAEMPSDNELHQNLATAFRANKLVAGIFLEIINLAKADNYIPSDKQYNELIITDEETFLYRYQFLQQKGIISRLDSELSNQPEHIKNPENLADLMTALALLQDKLDVKETIKSRIKAKNISIKQRAGFSDPTATMAGKKVATVNYGNQFRSPNFKNKNKNRRKTHTYNQCRNPANCRIHSRKKQNKPNNNWNKQQNNSPNYSNSKFKPNFNYNNQNSFNNQFQPSKYNSNNYNNNNNDFNFNPNNNNKPFKKTKFNRNWNKSWNSNSVKNNYNKSKRPNFKKKRRNFQQKQQNQQTRDYQNNHNNQNYRNQNNYNQNSRGYIQNPQSEQNQNYSHNKSFSGSKPNNSNPNIHAVNGRKHKFQKRKNKSYFNHDNYQGNQNQFQNKQHSQGPTHTHNNNNNHNNTHVNHAYIHTSNPVQIYNSDFESESDSSEIESLYFTTPYSNGLTYSA